MDPRAALCSCWRCCLCLRCKAKQALVLLLRTDLISTVAAVIVAAVLKADACSTRQRLSDMLRSPSAVTVAHRLRNVCTGSSRASECGFLCF